MIHIGAWQMRGSTDEMEALVMAARLMGIWAPDMQLTAKTARYGTMTTFKRPYSIYHRTQNPKWDALVDLARKINAAKEVAPEAQ